MRRVFFIGLLAGVTMLIVSLAWGAVASMAWPQLATAYQEGQVFRPWSDPLMSIFFLHPIMVGVIMAWLWSKTKHLLKIALPLKHGVAFGLIYWAVSIPGMIISYATFQISLLMVLSWTLNGLLQAIVAGIIFSYFDLLRKPKTA